MMSKDKSRNKMISYLGEKPIDNNHAGSKARIDVDRIFENRYIKSLTNVIAIEFKSIFEKFFYVLSISNWVQILTIRFSKGKNIIGKLIEKNNYK
mgnify:CR=1 FL=1